MADEPIPLTVESFTSKIAEVLTNWPLYRVLRFSGDVTDFRSKAYFPVELVLPCRTCDNNQRWRAKDAVVFGDGSQRYSFDALGNQFLTLAYTCKNCSRQQFVFFLLMEASNSGGSVAKVGQFPPLEREPSRVLKEAMEPGDLGLYRHALTSRNSNFGIGAVAYLRRIVENRINYLIDLIAMSPDLEPDSALLAKVAEMKGEKRFAEKIEFAAELLPKSLKRSGQNPIAMLHDLASEGLHGKSDDECIEIFDRCKLAFEYVIRRLKEDRDEDAGFTDAMKALSEKATRKKKG